MKQLHKIFFVFLLGMSTVACVTNHAPDSNKLLDGSDLVATAKARITEIDVKQLDSTNLKKHLLLDVREPNEYSEGHIPSAVSLPRGLLEFKILNIVNEYAEKHQIDANETPILLYCRSGSRGALAADTLQKMGFTKVSSIAGGYKAWHKHQSQEVPE